MDTSPPPPPPYMATFASNVRDPQLRAAIESGRLTAIAGIGAVGIIGILLLAIRTERRATRAINFVAVADAVLNRDAALVARTGRLTAAGKYQLAFAGNSVQGWFNVEAPTRGVSGRATVSADRQHAMADWAIRSLAVGFDAAALQAAIARRELIAVEAGYRKPSAVAEAISGPGVTIGADGVASIQVVPPPLR